MAALGIGVLGQVTGQRGDDFHSLISQKVCQILETGSLQNRQIATVDHVTTYVSSAFDKPSKTRIHFWRSTGNVEHADIAPLQETEAGDHRFTIHCFPPRWPGIHMTMPTRL